jgi:glycine/D-amino acid oxidase-like deaminating enzyme
MTSLARLDRSFWAASAAAAPPTTLLEDDRETTVVVIGAGFTGLSTALHLAERGVACVVLEASEIGGGASGRNNGQVIPTLSRPDPSAMAAKYGKERGERLASLVRDSAQTVFDIVRRHGIDCDAEQSGWIQPAHSPGRVKAVAEKRWREWGALGAPVELLNRKQVTELTGSDAWYGGWLNHTGGHINPLGLARGLAKAAIAKGATVYTGSPATGLSRRPDGRWIVRTSRGSLTAERVVIATNAYSDDLWPGLKRTIVPVFSFQMATRPVSDNVRGTLIPGRQAVSDTHGDLHFMRWTADNRLVTGGAMLSRIDLERRLQAHVGRRLQGLFPQMGEVTFDYVWAGYLAMTPDYFPRLHQLADGVATWIGCNGRGVALGTAMGVELAKWAANEVPIDELAMPATRLAPIPAHGFAKLVARSWIWLYRRRDAREM